MNIVITGASSGFGKAIAEKFAANGYSVFLCARNADRLSAFAAELQAKYPDIQVHSRVCDVSVKKNVEDFAQWILSITSEVDILINNAGIFIQGNVYDEPEGVLEQLMNTNLYSAYHLSRKLIPGMISRRKGHIFNICSIASLKAYKNGGSYGITKFALAGMSANLRDELREFDIKVTSVFPGAAYTGSWESSGIDANRMMDATDIARIIYSSAQLSPRACVEEIVLRPQLGDL